MDNLTERYIYAVTRQLPASQRDEVSRELDSLIADMLDERTGPIEPTDKDVRVVLTELGTPEEMALQYRGADSDALISGTNFLRYKRVLAIVLPIVALVLPFLTALSFLAEQNFPDNPYQFIGQLFGQAIGGTFYALLGAFAAITIIFAIFERQKISFENDMLSNLPELPKTETRIKAWEPILGILLTVLFVAVLLTVPWVMGVWTESTGWVGVFDTAILRSLWIPVILWGLLGILKEVFKLIEGRYTKRLAIVTLIVNVFILAIAASLLLYSPIFNPLFADAFVEMLDTEVGSIAFYVPRYFNLLFIVIIGFALVLDTATTWVKAFRNDLRGALDPEKIRGKVLLATVGKDDHHDA